MHYLIANLIILLLPFVSAGDTHNVTVGQEGSFFNPAIVAARSGDIVQFIFSGDSHGVIQAEQYAPCAPKVGGFSSGLSGREGNFSAEAPIWQLHIDDDSEPIWFYCPSLNPTSHCNSGMVGAINPPVPAAYDDFVNLAKIYPITSSVTSLPSVALSGVGAHATNSPAVFTPTSLITSTTASSSITLTSTSDIPAETSDSFSSSSSGSSGSSNIGAIVGGVIGGIVALVLLFVGVKYGRRYIKKSRRASKNFFEYQGNNPGMEQNYADRGPSLEQPSTIASINQGHAQPRNLFSMP